MERHLSLQVIQKKTGCQALLLAKAFRIVPGRDYNAVAYELREKNRDSLFQLYEVILQENEAWECLRDRIYPFFIRYLKYKSIDPSTAKGVIVSLFYKDQFYLIEGPEFIKAFCEIEGLNSAGFLLRVKRWLAMVHP